MRDKTLSGLLSCPAYLDSLSEKFREDPDSVDASLHHLFSEAAPVRGRATPSDSSDETSQRIYDVVNTFRQFGHLAADLDPLALRDRALDMFRPESFGFSTTDLQRTVSCDGFRGAGAATVSEHFALLNETYCGPIGVEYMDVLAPEERDWLEREMEPIRNHPRLERGQEHAILRELIAADTFEETLGKMYPGAKRFSLEGGTTLITLLNAVVEAAADDGAKHMALGMAHRGRLNVLAHVLRKPMKFILATFEERPQAEDVQGYGDVKYHLGWSHDYQSEAGNTIHLSLAFNPSHLEIINPVVEGIVRAKQAHFGDTERRHILPVLVHGDAAFAGQGVVAETLTLAGLDGYKTGGTVHIICNNQVGFTADPSETRSTAYASDWAKIVRAPVFHVNADHPEAVHLVGRLALAYRQRFHRDVVVDLICFRRHGHNEMDDASFTQPVMAQRIAQHKPVSAIYAAKLSEDGIVTSDDVADMRGQVRADMEEERECAKDMSAQFSHRFGGIWRGLSTAGSDWTADTAVSEDALHQVADALVKAPAGWSWHKRLKKLVEKRRDAIRGGEGLDWACGEALALGSLLLEGTPVRLSGQDSRRGTFSHRHAVYSDTSTGEKYTPLNHIAAGQAELEVINSPLSEEAVLAFEYGYSSADPWKLVMWEAQFGDFANGAQVVIDQLIASAEYKWGRMSGLVMLLPHGYEGQGPEHSSARIERFLELCAENNLQVVNPTTPVQMFHVLRRQIRRVFRKPLVVMTPKSLLRHPQAVSSLGEFCDGSFLPVIEEVPEDPAVVRKALLCSGKLYYALAAARDQQQLAHTTILRLEQLYPYPVQDMQDALKRFPNLKELVWVQEEPRNMGAWRNLLHRFQESTPQGVKLGYVGRDSRAVPATGSYEVHRQEEQDLIATALSDKPKEHVVRRGRKSDVKRRDRRRRAASRR